MHTKNPPIRKTDGMGGFFQNQDKKGWGHPTQPSDPVSKEGLEHYITTQRLP